MADETPIEAEVEAALEAAKAETEKVGKEAKAAGKAAKDEAVKVVREIGLHR